MGQIAMANRMKSEPISPGNGKPAGLIAVARQAFQALSSIATRAAVSAYLGKSYGGDRDIYTALGYNKTPVYRDYYSHYLRQDVARAIIDVPVRASWRKIPLVSESEADETEFEKAWTGMSQALDIWHYFSRVDRLAGIGEYAVMLIGFDDVAQLAEPVRRAGKVLYLMPYSQENAVISTYVTDSKDARFGLPSAYSVRMRSVLGAAASTQQIVHWSRIIHVAEDTLDDDVLGLPKLQPVLNRLQNLELVAGGSAEMFWRGAFPGLEFHLPETARLGTQTEALMEAEIEEYIHGLKRYIRTVGMDVKAIEQQLSDPSPHVSVFLDLICAAARIPKRILLGSERGELASTQDESNWYAGIDDRRRLHCEPNILRAFIIRCQDVGVLPATPDGYQVRWPDLMAQDDKTKAEVANMKSSALSQYVSSGAETLMPPAFFLQHVMGFDRDQMDQLEEIQNKFDNLANGSGMREPEPDPVSGGVG